MNKFILSIIRTFFGVFSRVAPGLSGRLAFRLFCTTFEPSSKSANRHAILEKAQQLFIDATQHDIDYSGGKVAAFEFKPKQTSTPAKTIWLVHGWQSHSLFMSRFVPPLLDQGFRVISIDLPGHGQSSGRTFHLPLAVSALHAVKDKLGDFQMALSHSLGGAVMATTLAGTIPDRPSLAVEKLVLISSPDSMRKIFDDFSTMVGLSKKANTHLHGVVTQLTGKTTDDFSTGAQLQTIEKQLLLIHAPDDKEVPFSQSESIQRLNPDATLEPAVGLGHRRIIAADDVVQRAVEFLKH